MKDLNEHVVALGVFAAIFIALTVVIVSAVVLSARRARMALLKSDRDLSSR